MAYQPKTLSAIADDLDQAGAKVASVKPCFPINTPQAEIDAHNAALQTSAAAYRRAAEIIRMQVECEA